MVFAWTNPSVAPPGGAPGPIPVSIGGTGATTLTGVLVGNGTSAFTNILPGASGNLLTSNGTVWISTASAGGIPTGIVSFFNLTTCPAGWTEFTNARGRYIIGLPLSGTLAGTNGTALTNLEDRPVGQHTHTINDPSHSHNPQKNTYGSAGQSRLSWVSDTWGDPVPFPHGPPSTSSTTGITINNTGSVAGTAAPYIQLLVCQKN